MSVTVRITQYGYEALTETDLSKYVLYADSDNILIKEQSRGSGTVALNNIATIAHNLGYIPFYKVWCEVASGKYRVANAYDPVGSGWRAYADTTNLYVYNLYSSSFTSYKYFIFHDNLN